MREGLFHVFFIHFHSDPEFISIIDNNYSLTPHLKCDCKISSWIAGISFFQNWNWILRLLWMKQSLIIWPVKLQNSINWYIPFNFTEVTINSYLACNTHRPLEGAATRQVFIQLEIYFYHEITVLPEYSRYGQFLAYSLIADLSYCLQGTWPLIRICTTSSCRELPNLQTGLASFTCMTTRGRSRAKHAIHGRFVLMTVCMKIQSSLT